MQLFQKATKVTVNVNNKAHRTSMVFNHEGITEVSTATSPQKVWTSEKVTQNVALNSNFLSGEVKLSFHRMARDSGIADADEFQKLAFPNLSQALEVAANLIREGKVEPKIDGVKPAVYIMFSHNACIIFFHNGLYWEFYFKKAVEKYKSTQIEMYEIGNHCTVISFCKEGLKVSGNDFDQNAIYRKAVAGQAGIPSAEDAEDHVAKAQEVLKWVEGIPAQVEPVATWINYLRFVAENVAERNPNYEVSEMDRVKATIQKEAVGLDDHSYQAAMPA